MKTKTPLTQKVKKVSKAISYALFITLFTTTINSCDGSPEDDIGKTDPPKETPTLSVSTTQVANVVAAGGNTKITITTNQSAWSATSDVAWCKVTDKTEKGFTLVVDANSDTSERNATVTVSAGKATPVKVTVTQQGSAPTLLVSPTEIADALASGGDSEISVTTNLSEWSATSDKEWCKVTDKTEKGFTIIIEPNYSVSPRNATITVSADKATPVEISVTQAGETPELFVAPSGDKNMPASSGSSELLVYTNLSDWSVTSDVDWCKITDKTEQGFNITVEQNNSVSTRNATITVSADKATPIKFSVIQSGATPVLSVSPTKVMSVPISGSDSEISVTTNLPNWSATSEVTWCKVTDKTESGFKIVVEANSSPSPRETTVMVKADKATPVKITVTQWGAPPILSLSPGTETIFFSASAKNEKYTYKVTTNEPAWEANMTPADATWCKLTKDVANNSFTITADTNESTSPRGPVIVKVSAGSARSLEITINQNPQPTQESEDYEYGEGSEWD